MTHRRWSDDEIEIVKRNYRRGGVTLVKQLLGKHRFDRTAHAIALKARTMGLHYDPTAKSKYVPLSEAMSVSTNSTRPHPHILEAAREAGVLHRAPTHPRPYLAPAAWVDAWMVSRGREEDRIRLAVGSWMTSEQAAQEFGVPLPTFRTAASRSQSVNCQGLARHLCRIESLRVMRPQQRTDRPGGTKTTFWRPDQVRIEAARYRAYRRQSPWHHANGKVPD